MDARLEAPRSPTRTRKRTVSGSIDMTKLAKEEPNVFDDMLGISSAQKPSPAQSPDALGFPSLPRQAAPHPSPPPTFDIFSQPQAPSSEFDIFQQPAPAQQPVPFAKQPESPFDVFSQAPQQTQAQTLNVPTSRMRTFTSAPAAAPSFGLPRNSAPAVKEDPDAESDDEDDDDDDDDGSEDVGDDETKANLVQGGAEEKGKKARPVAQPPSHLSVRPPPQHNRAMSQDQGMAAQLKEGEWIQEFDALKLMKEGTSFLKYGQWGIPHFRPFRLSQDNTKIIWSSKNKSKESTQIEIHRIRKIITGQQTKTFQRQAAPELARASFSIIYDNDKTLDVVAKNHTDHSVWVQGLQALIEAAQNNEVQGIASASCRADSVAVYSWKTRRS